jgi:hypothetical protein
MRHIACDQAPDLVATAGRCLSIPQEHCRGGICHELASFATTTSGMRANVRRAASRSWKLRTFAVATGGHDERRPGFRIVDHLPGHAEHLGDQISRHDLAWVALREDPAVLRSDGLSLSMLLADLLPQLAATISWWRVRAGCDAGTR